MALSFFEYLCSFFRYSRFCIKSDDVIGCSTKTAQHSIENNSINTKAVFFKLGTSNGHHKRNLMTPLCYCHDNSYAARSVLISDKIARFYLKQGSSTPANLMGSVKPGFQMSGKSQMVWDFIVSRLSQILLTNENSKSWISPIVWDEWEQIWRIGRVSIFTALPRFLRWSTIILDK